MKPIFQSIRFILLMTILTGGIYPLLTTIISQSIFPKQANGSLISSNDRVIGSELIAQSFKDKKYFWSRPSAVDFNPIPSGASNFGPTSQALKDAVEERRKNGLTADLLYSSGSGLDPDMSPEAAFSQTKRVAEARHVQESDVRDIVTARIEERQFRLFGERRINVLKLNLALDERFK